MKARKLLQLCVVLSAILTLFFVEMAAADVTTSGLALASITKHVDTTIGQLGRIISDIALITGIFFILASFFKFHQHKLNPTQVPVSQGVTLLMIGAALTVFVVMLPTAKTAVFGSSVKVAKIGGSDMHSLIGS